MERNTKICVLEKTNVEVLFDFKKIDELLESIFGIEINQLTKGKTVEYHLLNLNKLCIVIHGKNKFSYQKIEGVEILEKKQTTCVIFDEKKTKNLKKTRYIQTDECVHKPNKTTLEYVYSTINNLNRSLKEINNDTILKDIKNKIEDNSEKIENLNKKIDSLMFKYHGVQLKKNNDMIDINDVKSFILYTIYDVFDNPRKKEYNKKYIEYHRKLKRNVKNKKKNWKGFIVQIEHYIAEKNQEIYNSDLLIEDIEKDCNNFLKQEIIKKKMNLINNVQK